MPVDTARRAIDIVRQNAGALRFARPAGFWPVPRQPHDCARAAALAHRCRRWRVGRLHARRGFAMIRADGRRVDRRLRR